MNSSEVKPAVRFVRPGWRDPRIIGGLVIVAVSVLLGARVLAAADQMRPAWTVVRDLPEGAQLTGADLALRPVRLTSPTVNGYFVSTSTPPVGRLTHALSAGELVPRAAIRTGPVRARVELPISAAPEDLPPDVRIGSVIDVWALPGSVAARADGPATPARRLLDGVSVVAAPRQQDALAPTTTRTVVVLVDATLDLTSVLSALATSRPLLTVHSAS